MSTAPKQLLPSSCTNAASSVLQTGVHTYSARNATAGTFFLHLPRTAGRSLHFCLLKALVPQHKRCTDLYTEESVRHLEVDRNIHAGEYRECGLLASHGGLDVAYRTGFAVHNVAVQLRAPVQRLLSAYTFALEVAASSTARGLNLNLPDASVRKRHHLPPKSNMQQQRARVRTYDVWPWSYIVPYFEKLLLEQAYNVTERQPTSSLAKCAHLTGALTFDHFVHTPLAHELLHNGQMLQLLGLSNLTITPAHQGNARTLRHCLTTQCTDGSNSSMGLLLHKAKHLLLHDVGLVTVKEQMQHALPRVAQRLGHSLSAPTMRSSHDAATTVQESWNKCSSKEGRKASNRQITAYRLLGGRLPTYDDLSHASIERVRRLNWADDLLHQTALQLVHA